MAIYVATAAHTATLPAAEPTARVRQITFGPRHHLFGYIGQCRTVPWNASGRYILALETDFGDRMPTATDAADVVLLDANDDYAPRIVDRTRAWNFQQGTMFYWNPHRPEAELFFNDRDAANGHVFAVLYDTATDGGGRKREYRFENSPVGNSGVSPAGGRFAAINYGRLARLRPVTGYPQAWDWSQKENQPADDGVFVVDIATGKRSLVASFHQMADLLRAAGSDVDGVPLFINHTLWSPDGERLFFFCRGNFGNREKRINASFVVRADGSELTLLKDHIGGHPEWLDAQRMIGKWNNRQGVYDIDRQTFVGTIGLADTFADPEGDIALSPDGRWLVNGASHGAENTYTFWRLADGLTYRAGPLARGPWVNGKLRIDGAPCWNRDATAILTTAWAEDDTRQIFLIELPPAEANTPCRCAANGRESHGSE